MSEEVYKSKFDLHVSIMLIAEFWAKSRSKDPRTQVGAVVYDPKIGSIHAGYNGLCEGHPDLKKIWDNRDVNKPNNKYEHVVHAEVNAVRKAYQCSKDISHCTLYITHFPCPECMKNVIIPSKIKVVYVADREHETELSNKLAALSGVVIRDLQMPEFSFGV